MKTRLEGFEGWARPDTCSADVALDVFVDLQACVVGPQGQHLVLVLSWAPVAVAECRDDPPSMRIHFHGKDAMAFEGSVAPQGPDRRRAALASGGIRRHAMPLGGTLFREGVAVEQLADRPLTI